MTILDQLAGCARERTGQAKLRISLEELKQQALSLPKENIPGVYYISVGLRKKKDLFFY